MLTGLYIAAETSAVADTLYAQYYPPSGYGYPPSSRPPCEAVTPGPFQGAARGGAEVLLSGRFRAMPGAVPQSGPASALSAVEYVGARPAAPAHVTDAMIGCRLRKRLGGGLSTAEHLSRYAEPRPVPK